MSGIVGVQDKFLDQVTCGVKQDVLENKNAQFKVVFVPCLHRPVCSGAIYLQTLGREHADSSRITSRYPNIMVISQLATQILTLFGKKKN